jgi:hypothetical protein
VARIDQITRRIGLFALQNMFRIRHNSADTLSARILQSSWNDPFLNPFLSPSIPCKINLYMLPGRCSEAEPDGADPHRPKEQAGDERGWTGIKKIITSLFAPFISPRLGAKG